jgi:hypothetical protein
VYWNNPIIQITWPCDQDPILQSTHNGQHCLFFHPAVPLNTIQPQQTLQQLCDLANHRLDCCSRADFVQDHSAHDWMANIVKINLMVVNLLEFGCVKPVLLAFHGQLPFVPGTGDSRLKALTRIPSITTVPAFISTSVQYRAQFANLEIVDNIDKFAQHCDANAGNTFLFRLTDSSAAYGLDWYEYDCNKVFLPSIDWCIRALQRYLYSQASDFVFSESWFHQHIEWDQYL